MPTVILDFPVTAIQPIDLPVLQRKNLKVWVKREDQLHPQLSGNKWHKLRLNIEAAKGAGINRLVSFGGPYSNHLHALAWAGKRLNMATVGLVRGEVSRPLNPTLTDAKAWGMSLVPVSRSEYRTHTSEDYLRQIQDRFGPCLVIPEGGANALGIEGCKLWGRTLRQQMPNMDYLCLACGTGATLAGLAQGIGAGVELIGFSALKNDFGLVTRIEDWMAQAKRPARWRIVANFHCGGFAKMSTNLLAFMDEWEQRVKIPLEPVYTAKMMMGVFQMVKQDGFVSGSKIVILHSGGLQGMRGMYTAIAQMRNQAKQAQITDKLV